jgi:PAS domain S-box-containing protein
MKYEHVEGLAQALFEETGDAMFFFDPDTNQLLDANSAAQRLTGFSLQKLLHLTVPDLIHSVSEEGSRKLKRASQKTAVFHSQEGYFLKTVKENVRIPVNLTITRLHVRPQTLGLITARDVRKQREAFAQLKSVEAELRRVMAAVTDCLWSAQIDDAGKCSYHYFSPVVEKITGLPPRFFLLGMHRWWSIVHPDDQARWTRALAQQRAGRSTQGEYRVVSPDGTSRWVREVVQVSRGTAERGVMRLDGVITDISERKQIEMRFQAFMDNIPALAFIKDPQGRYVYVNRAFQRAFSKRADEINGKRDADFFPPEVINQLHANDAAVLESDQPLQSVESRPSAGGVLQPWAVYRFPLRDESGSRLIGGVALDLTEVRPVAEQPQSA